MFLLISKKFRAFFSKYPVAGILLMLLAFALMLTAIDLWRSRKWLAGKCGRKVTIKKQEINAIEWAILLEWLRQKSIAYALSADTVSADMSAPQFTDFAANAHQRGWKYTEKEGDC